MKADSVIANDSTGTVVRSEFEAHTFLKTDFFPLLISAVPDSYN
jgi:hypothetical protein